MSKADIICWLDIETDGTPDPMAGHLIEFACIFTTPAPPFVELEAHSFLVHCAFDIPTIRDKAPEAVRLMHDNNGLWKEWEVANLADTVKSARGIENLLFDRLHANSYHGDMVVGCGGSGVAAFDRPWLRYWMPNLERLFPYWSYDIGSVRRIARLAGWNINDPSELSSHRALDDVKETLRQARRFTSLVRG
jgi:oligoribonuclease (3'-5' exoribonuclease)